LKYIHKGSIYDKIEKTFTGKKLEKASKYYGIDKRQVVYTSIHRSLIVGLTIGFSMLLLNPSLGITLGVASFIVTLSTLLQIHPKRYDEERLELERYGATFLETFSTTLDSTESIPKAIIAVANQKIPNISKRFHRVAKRVENGEAPEALILQLADSLPSQTLNRTIRRIIDKASSDKTSTQEEIEITEREIRRYFKNATAQMEGRITVIFAIDFFFPTVVVISASMLGLVDSPLILLLIPFHLCLIDLTQNKLVKRVDDLLW
jgi:hypothetical protein